MLSHRRHLGSVTPKQIQKKNRSFFVCSCNKMYLQTWLSTDNVSIQNSVRSEVRRIEQISACIATPPVFPFQYFGAKPESARCYIFEESHIRTRGGNQERLDRIAVQPSDDIAFLTNGPPNVRSGLGFGKTNYQNILVVVVVHGRGSVKKKTQRTKFIYI
jgi:hypothetical protein